MYYLFLWASRLVPRLPRWLLRVLPAGIGFLAWLLVLPARKQATINALHVLGSEVRSTRGGRARLRKVVRGIFRYSVSNYLEAFLLPGATRQEIVHRVYIEHEEYLKEALALGKGAILFSAHLGPFEALASWLAVNGYEAVIPVENLKDERLLRLMVELRGSQGVNFLPLGGSAPMRKILQALRNNQVVLLTADRAVHGENAVKDFFGAPASLPLGPVKLALRTGAPLLGGFGWYSPHQRIEGAFFRLLVESSLGTCSDEDIIEEALIKQMEQVISAHPEQWVVFSKVWTD